ncbi:hypothetical protein NOJ28_13170 [Neorhizobium galegae]|uniref:hypothetical protein n=1 Tax=Neorhizobium galegae TaxID=399 RepID=UPI000621D63E|nr:hypothetical protein [Neorhizobium galegae]MCQ1766489.1 hypothetical protein [Neorhizobium galegae]MCQ1845403.1 hypothetical protein [Neorhizobium galegae]CDZ36283.1 Hypothetical protein NGAL_HAMBI1146_17850 [Neorhizobium galegae bv. officinalis]
MTENTDSAKIHKDAEGQYAKSQADGKANGVASAKPTVITGSDDATEHRDPLGKKGPEKDWDVNFDVAERPRHA